MLHTKQPGIRYGLKLKLKASKSSIYLFIHNRTEKRTLGKKIYVSAATHSNFALSRIFENKLNTPANKCREKSVTISGNGSSEVKKRPYSQHECFTICYYKRIVENCNQSEKFPQISDNYYDNPKLFYALVYNITSKCDKTVIKQNKELFDISGNFITHLLNRVIF